MGRIYRIRNLCIVHDLERETLMPNLKGMMPTKHLYTCKVKTTATQLEPDDAEILLNAVMDERWTINALTVELNNRGVQISKEPIKRHREKVCSCWNN